MKTSYTIGYTFGFGMSILIVVALGWLLLMPFGYGYIGAELLAAYTAWSVIHGWDRVIAHYQSGLDEF